MLKLSVTLDQIFNIPGRGTIISAELLESEIPEVGSRIEVNGNQHTVKAIEQFKKMYTPDEVRNIGIVLERESE